MHTYYIEAFSTHQGKEGRGRFILDTRPLYLRLEQRKHVDSRNYVSLTHLEHQRPFHDPAAYSKHSGEKSREAADERIPNSIDRVPFNIAFDILVVQLLLQLPTLDKVLTHQPESIEMDIIKEETNKQTHVDIRL